MKRRRAINRIIDGEALKDRAIGSGKVSSVVGLVLSTAIAGASEYYTASGGYLGSWQPYAVAGAVAVAGLLFRKPTN